MNAFTTKISSFCNAHKILLMVLVLILNVVLLLAEQATSVRLFGKVEALNHRWTNYTELHQNYIQSKIHYSRLGASELDYKTHCYHYEYSKSKGRDYLVLGTDKPVMVRHNRVYYLDEQCSLTFSGIAKMTLKNVSFRCLY